VINKKFVQLKVTPNLNLAETHAKHYKAVRPFSFCRSCLLIQKLNQLILTPHLSIH